MAGKTVPLSVRVSDDDAAFLAGLEIAGATTPSEKLRAVLSAERRRYEGAQDPGEATEFFRDLMRLAQNRIRRLEAGSGQSSDVVLKLYERLPALCSTLFMGPQTDTNPDALELFEARLLDQSFALIQELLELGLLTRSRCYDMSAISARIDPVLELVDLIRLSKERRNGDR